MVTATSIRKPNYFLVVFGVRLPDPPTGGVYGIHRKGYIKGRVFAGDVLLLYENLGAPGIGVVTSTETSEQGETIRYQYFPFCHPLTWVSQGSLQHAIPGLKVPLNYIGNWVQDLTTNSFRSAVAGRQIDWP
jgi:hypothetical protein